MLLEQVIEKSLPALAGGLTLFTITVIAAVLAQCPAGGVKVYVVVAVLFTAGDHVPVNPFMEVEGKVIVPPEQIDAIGLKVGVAGGPTFTVSVVVVAH